MIGIKIEPFEKYSKEYDEWFLKNQNIYLAELNAIKSLVPSGKFGVGTARFALPLEIKDDVDPSRKMAEISRKQGIKVYKAIAEQLPFNEKTLDFNLFVTTICFVDDLVESLKEPHRDLKTDGFIVVGFADKESRLDKRYQLKREKSKFYKYANFYSVKKVIDFLRTTNFEGMIITQTVFSCLTNRLDSLGDEYRKGNFVIIKANKK